jgi:hypothetical protein
MAVVPGTIPTRAWSTTMGIASGVGDAEGDGDATGDALADGDAGGDGVSDGDGLGRFCASALAIAQAHDKPSNAIART